MASYKFCPLYVGAKKCGECEQTKWSFMANGEQLVSADEVAESTGVVTSEATFDTILPFGSASIDMMDLVLKQTPVEIGIGPVNGKFYKVAGKVIKADGTSVSKTGVTKGNFQFRGGTPKAI